MANICCEELQKALDYRAIFYHVALKRYMLVGEDSEGGRMLNLSYCPFCAKAIGRYKYFRTKELPSSVGQGWLNESVDYKRDERGGLTPVTKDRL